MNRLVLVVICLLIACSSAYAGPAGTERKVRFDPPVVYAIWWNEIEECSETSRPFGAVRWYMVPAEDLSEAQGGAVGLTWPAKKRAYIPSGYLYYKGIVQHEMLHVLGFRGHPIPPFGKCAPAWAWLP